MQSNGQTQRQQTSIPLIDATTTTFAMAIIKLSCKMYCGNCWPLLIVDRNSYYRMRAILGIEVVILSAFNTVCVDQYETRLSSSICHQSSQASAL